MIILLINWNKCIEWWNQNKIKQNDVIIYGQDNCKARQKCFCFHNSKLTGRTGISSTVESKRKLKPLSMFWGTENKIENASLRLIAWFLSTRCFIIEILIDLGIPDPQRYRIIFFLSNVLDNFTFQWWECLQYWNSVFSLMTNLMCHYGFHMKFS